MTLCKYFRMVLTKEVKTHSSVVNRLSVINSIDTCISTVPVDGSEETKHMGTVISNVRY
jgi:hypothetical protein